MQNNLRSIILILAALVATACTPGAPNNPAAPAAVMPVVEPTEAESAATVANDTAATAVPAEEVAGAESAGAEPAATMTKLDLNTVTGDELLATIPDFGSRMVREFLEYRPYVSIQQFRQEMGKYVDEAQIAFYEEYVYVPVSRNDSDAATLMQIPGIDAALADALVAARPFDTDATFLQKLAELAPTVDGTVAQAYLEAE